MEFVLQFLRPIGISEPVLLSMFVAAILGLSIYLTLYTGMFSLANGGFMAIGAYVGVVLTQYFGWSLLPALLMAMLVTGIVAIPIGLPVLRLNDIYLAISTIGFGEVVRVVILNIDKIIEAFIGWMLSWNIPELTAWLHMQDELSPYLELRSISTGTRVVFEFIGGARGIRSIPVLTEDWMLLLFILLTVLFLLRLHDSRFGRAMAAIRQDARAAATMGIDVVATKNIVFFMSAVLAGAAGVFEGHLLRIITPDGFGFDRTVDILAYAVLGGTQNFVGPIVGGMVLKALPEVLRSVKQLRGLFTGLVLLGAIVYLPNGLLNIEGIKSLFWKEARTPNLSPKGRGEQQTEADDAGT
jgi:branched-chain amino acid transport system permease protein